MDAPNQGQSKVKGVVHTWYQFSTKSLSSWNDLQALWYVNGVKVVPQNIFEMLTPISLAYWVCDDGVKVETVSILPQMLLQPKMYNYLLMFFKINLI